MDAISDLYPSPLGSTNASANGMIYSTADFGVPANNGAEFFSASRDALSSPVTSKPNVLELAMWGV
jgi:hypothetical protein